MSGDRTNPAHPIPLAAATLSRIRTAARRPVSVPSYDRAALRPSILHIGVGGFHRAHFATYVDEMCSSGDTSWAIVGAGVLPGDAAIAAALAAQDHLYSLVVRGEKEHSVSVIGSLVDYIHAHPDPTALIERVAAPDTQIVSMTVTEGGYPVDDATGAYDPASSVGGAGSAFGILARALNLRRRRGTGPLTVMSFDNIESNGRVCRTATLGEAARIGDELSSWVAANIAFPNSMVDRITPGTTDADRAWLADEVGIADRWPVVTEPFRLWVLEDRFSGERLPVERLDVVVTEDVQPFELMKLRLLNAAHSTMAYLAALAGHEFVHDAMADPVLRGYVEGFLDREARPVLPPVPGYDVDVFHAGLIERFANPAIRDQVARLCLDGSAKFPKFLMPTIEAQLEAGGPIELSALALAGWCQYLLGHDQVGRPLQVSPDPRLAEAVAHAEASRSRPAAFLEFDAVFPETVAGDARFSAAFTSALVSLRRDGAQGTVARSIRSQP